MPSLLIASILRWSTVIMIMSSDDLTGFRCLEKRSYAFSSKTSGMAVKKIMEDIIKDIAARTIIFDIRASKDTLIFTV
jgi:hypothetical protein